MIINPFQLRKKKKNNGSRVGTNHQQLSTVITELSNDGNNAVIYLLGLNKGLKGEEYPPREEYVHSLRDYDVVLHTSQIPLMIITDAREKDIEVLIYLKKSL